MIFLSKLLPHLIYPLSLSIWLTVLAIVLVAFRRRRAGIALLCTSTALLWICSMPIVSSSLIASIERRYLPVLPVDSESADAIVVLGGCVGAAEPPRVSVELTDASDRLLHAARLYRAGKAPFVIVSGGGLPWLGERIPEAVAMAELLEEWGVPKTAIIVEPKSANTFENAANTRLLIRSRGIKRILLVTSAFHMPRALFVFQKAGIDAIPSPTDYGVTDRDRLTIFDFLPTPDALSGTTLAIKEYLGMLVYRWLKIEGERIRR